MSVFMEELIIYILYLSSNITSMFLLCNATMKRRHAPTVWIVYCIIKTIIVNIVFRIFCDELIRTNEWMRCIYLTLVSVFAILTYIMMLYTFEEELSKIAVVSVCAELVATSLGYLSRAVTNTLIGEAPFRESAPLHVMDFVSAVLTILMTLALLKIGKMWIDKIRRWEVVRKKTVMVWFVGYLLFSLVSMYFSFEKMLYLDGIGSIIFSMILLVQFANYFHRKTLWENETLKRQQRLAQMQYEAVVLQMEKMEQMQKEIETQMQTVLKLSDNSENMTEQVERYLMSLKQHSEKVTTGIFCNDWFLDYVLHSARKKCEEKGIQTEFYLQGYQKIGGHNEKLVKDIQELLDSTMQKTKDELYLQVANVKGRVMIKIERDGKEETFMWS